MIIKPYSSFTSVDDEAIANFADLALFWRMDDFTPSGGDTNTWVDRVSGVTLHFTANTPGSIMRKDSDGIYADDAQAITITGTMPTPSNLNYAVLMAIGTTGNVNSINGLTFVLGSSAASKMSISTQGAVTSNNVAQRAAISVTSLTTAAKPACQLACVDLVDQTSPAIRRVISNDNYSAAVSVSSASASTTLPSAGDPVTPNQLNSAATFSSLGAGAGERLVSLAFFLFTSNPTDAQLTVAATEAARTRRLPAIFRS